jgi:hypothetical protein
MEPDEVARAIGVMLVDRLPHGENAGAYAVRTSDGVDAVLKVGAAPPDDGAGEIVTALRGRGYPIPRQLLTGTLDDVRYELLERAAGVPMDQLEQRHVSAVLALNDLQRAIGIGSGVGWVEHMVTSVTDGMRGYCEHAALRAHSDGTRALLDRLCRLAEARRAVDVPTGDAVHYDFSPFNIVMDGDRVSGVVDWDATRIGDSAFDLITLSFYCFDEEVREALVTAARARTSPPALELYAAHMVLRQVDWSLRHHGSAEAEWYMGIGDALLGRVAT